MNISKREFELLILISCSKFKNPIAIINLVKLINIDRRHPTFMKIKKMLIKEYVYAFHQNQHQP